MRKSIVPLPDDLNRPEIARQVPIWPLWVLALPATVAIWSGWVGLGALTGFGVVDLLPGITEIKINTAITLPVGMAIYAAYALRAWLTPGTPPAARRFAQASALGALSLDAAAQIAYHLMIAAGVTVAPWPIITVVSALPVVVLGMAAALAYLLMDQVAAQAPGVDSAPPADDPDRGEDPSGPLRIVDPRGVTPGGPQCDVDPDVARVAELVARGRADDRKIGWRPVVRELGVTKHRALALLREVERRSA
ncbi:MAG: hypothetical protein ACRDTG_19080 [Pseudonocardiaceae bacterium]